MAINFPTSLDSLSNPAASDLVENATAALDHHTQHANANDAIEALEAKVGADSSAVTTSHDYKLGEVTGSDRAVSKTATQTLTNKTLTSPTITTPTITVPVIADLSSATHTHQNNAGGGQLVATSVFASGTVPTARLGSGSATSATFLRGDQTWATPTPTITSGSGSFDMSATTTINIAHSLATVPTFVRVTVIQSNADFVSWGMGIFSSAASYLSTYFGLGSSTTNSRDTTLIIAKDASNYTTVTITRDATNVILDFSKTGSPTGTAIYLWEAIK